MSDVIDDAQLQCELAIEAQLQLAVKLVPKLPYTGDCYNDLCANTPPPPQPFCSEGVPSTC